MRLVVVLMEDLVARVGCGRKKKLLAERKKEKLAWWFLSSARG
jgi:hypothetical protein